MSGADKKPALSPTMAIAGGALADTLGLQQNTDAILKLAASNEALADARRKGNDVARTQSKIADEILDELKEMRRAIEEAASVAARKNRFDHP
jgi:chaperonin GroEL (HSP60 family)